MAARRARVNAVVRDFFAARGVLEVETPALSRGVCIDAHIDVFSSRYLPSGQPDTGRGAAVYLQSSPELHMKRLLAAGYPDIFQICKVFRNGECGRLHNPEFTMLEWYRHGFSMDCFMEETAQLCRAILGAMNVVRMSYAEAFERATGIDPLEATEGQLAECANRRYGGGETVGTTRADLLNFIMTEYVEPSLPADSLCFVYGFPSCLASLGLIEPSDPRRARRFELYAGGVELCNGYEELFDAEENRRRMEEENRRRAGEGKEELALDERFLRALGTADMGAWCGAALGLDRLVMLSAGKKSIGDVLGFPWETA